MNSGPAAAIWVLFSRAISGASMPGGRGDLPLRVARGPDPAAEHLALLAVVAAEAPHVREGVPRLPVEVFLLVVDVVEERPRSVPLPRLVEVPGHAERKLVGPHAERRVVRGRTGPGVGEDDVVAAGRSVERVVKRHVGAARGERQGIRDVPAQHHRDDPELRHGGSRRVVHVQTRKVDRGVGERDRHEGSVVRTEDAEIRDVLDERAEGVLIELRPLDGVLVRPDELCRQNCPSRTCRRRGRAGASRRPSCRTRP